MNAQAQSETAPAGPRTVTEMETAVMVEVAPTIRRDFLGRFVSPLAAIAFVVALGLSLAGILTSVPGFGYFDDAKKTLLLLFPLAVLAIYPLADHVSLFLGRVSMVMIVLLVVVMIFDVFMRYVIETPSVWANATSFWITGAIFLLAGSYAMQQRSHIRIFILYDLFPRGVQRFCDVFSVLLICLFAYALIWGSYNNTYRAMSTLQGWGEAWSFVEPTTVYFLSFFGLEESDGRIYIDPPIPSTLKPLILIAATIVALQAVANLIADWNKEKETHNPADD